MQWGVLLRSLLGEDGSLLIDGFTDNVDNTSESFRSDGDLDGLSGISTLLPPDETIGRFHGNGTDGILTQVLRYLEDETVALAVDLESIENFG